MTTEQKRIAIAEACGIKIPEQWIGDARNEASFLRCDVPNYLADLNAMHEAEKSLLVKQWPLYLGNLATIKGWDRDISMPSSDGSFAGEFRAFIGGMTHSTAAQRAEAFLRTIGKWQD